MKGPYEAIKEWSGVILPQKLKYRLFLAFVLLILLPFCLLNMSNYRKIEAVIQAKISEQSHAQLESLQGALQDQMSIAFKTLIFLEQDSTVRSILKAPQQNKVLENMNLMEEQFKGLNNSFFLYNPSVYFTVLDMHGNIYTSYLPKEPLDYRGLISHPRFQDSLNKGEMYQWVPHDDNYVFRDISASPSLLSLYAVMRDHNHHAYGLVRISIDYAYWFQSVLHSSGDYQEYFIFTGQGDRVAQSVVNGHLSQHAVHSVLTEPSRNGYLIDHDSESLINFSYIDSLDWYMVNRIPLAILFSEIHVLKQNYFVTFGLFTAAFIIIAFGIAYTVTRPLAQLQMKMKQAVRKDLSIRLPEQRYKGEIQELARTFNTILSDMNEMIQRLKMEERQKDAVHFQMLLAQMNPHFLLNTLNTMKWIALRHEQDDIAEICISLGKLLETSLNSEVDLIYLKEEMELIRAFVYIQQIRYNHRFQVEIDDDLGHDYVLVPKLSLQPLVENAIKYGIAYRPEGGIIRIRIRNNGQESLVIEVEDNGIGFEQARQQKTDKKRSGIGLNNIRQRLNLLFKEKGSLEIVHLKEGTMVRLTLPFLLSTPYNKKFGS